MFTGFKTFNFDEGVPYVSVTKNGVTFNKAVIMKMGYPAFVQLLINSDSKQIAVKACVENAENSIAFYKEGAKVLSIRWNVKDLLNTICEISGWDVDQNGYRIDGVHIKEENAILFDLKKGRVLL